MNVEAAITRIRQFKAEKNLSGAALARLADLHENTLRDIDKPDWNPRAETLRKLEGAIEGQERSGAAAE